MSRTIKAAVRFPNGEAYEYSNVWDRAVAKGEAEKLTGKVAQEAVTNYIRSQLLEFIAPGSSLTAVRTHYSRSSGTARYRVFAVAHDRNGAPYIRQITQQVAALCGFRLSKENEITMGGYGYSKSFQIGYSLGLALWPNGTPEPHGTRNGEPDSCGGYALSVSAA